MASTHGRLVHRPRVRVLAAAVGELLEPGWRVLDVGCGDGLLGSLIAHADPGLRVEGFEVDVREPTAIPVKAFDGLSLPVDDKSWDAVLMVDVLHHSHHPMRLLAEAARVAGRAVIVKDHRLDHPLARPVLRLMDWVSNRGHQVKLPYNYWGAPRWRQAFDELGLSVESYRDALGLYPWPARWLFERGLHFLVRLGVPR
jgi:SAM-dependent methyltransferase